MAIKKPTYQIIVHNDSENTFQHVVEVFQSVLGYEMSQAANCANIVHHKGKYAVKTVKDKENAEAFLELLLDYGLDAEIETFSKK